MTMITQKRAQRKKQKHKKLILYKQTGSQNKKRTNMAKKNDLHTETWHICMMTNIGYKTNMKKIIRLISNIINETNSLSL